MSLNLSKAIRLRGSAYWVGQYVEGDPLQCHPYLIENGDESIVIDPGSVSELDTLIPKIEMICPLSSIKYIILHHQDPDLAAAVPELEKRIGRKDLKIVTHSRMTVLIQHYGICSDYYEIDKHGYALKTSSGMEAHFYTIPYCHSPGAFMTYLPKAKVLFSGDLFGGLESSWALYADADYFESIKGFHQEYMPSQEILCYALSKVEKLDLDLIAPQHGSIIPKEHISSLISQMKCLKCGLYIDQGYSKGLIESMREAEEGRYRVETILEASPNAVIAIDETQRVTLFNRRAEEIFCVNRDEMIGHDSLERIMPADFFARHKEGLEKFLKAPYHLSNNNKVYELEGLRSNGERFPIRISFGTHIGQTGLIIVATIQDITNELRREDILQRQTHFAQMGEMLGMIMHQWRQPLTAIATTNETMGLVLGQGKINIQTLQKYTERIKKYVAHLNATIEDFKDFFKPVKSPVTTNCNQLVVDVLDIVSAQLSYRDITLKTDLCASEFLLTYSGEIKQVILNLIKNAEDAFEEKNIDAPEIYIRTYKEDNMYVISVEDNAGGVPIDILANIFDILFTTKGEKNGTGMGLYMSKIIIEEHCRGSLSVENTPKGARFTIRIPSLDIFQKD